MLSVPRTLWALAHEHRPSPQQPVAVEGWRPARPLRAGVPFSVLSWNLQFCGSRQHHFFYDGGDAVIVPAADVATTLAGVGALLDTEAPDLALLQELDRCSDRTGRVDQLPALVRAMGAATSATATYHRSFYVPKPARRPMGRVDVHLALLSTAPMRGAQRTQLSLKGDNRLVQAFDLKRALLTADVAVVDSPPLAVAVTHLSAFSYGDGTLDKQVATLEAWMASQPADRPWILAGDFNLLPPGDDPTRLAVEADLYGDRSNPMQRLIPRFREVSAESGLLEAKNRSYLPFGATVPDRRIDYFFVGGPIDVLDAGVLPETGLSDHMPLWARLRIRRPGA